MNKFEVGMVYDQTPQDIETVRSGWLIFDPKGNHYFKAYDGNGGYYAVTSPDDAYLFLTEHNAVSMAKRLKGKTTLVARAEIAVKVDFAAAEAVKGAPMDDTAVLGNGYQYARSSAATVAPPL